MIYKKLFLTFLFLIYAAAVETPLKAYGYQARGGRPASVFESVRSNRYFFWEASSSTNKIYILGSIHLAKKDMYPLSREIESAFERSDVLALEVNLAEINELEVAALTLTKAIYRDGSTLESRLSNRTYQLTKKRLSDLGMDIRMFNIYQPWFLAVTLTVQALMDLGFNPEWGVDKYFLNKAVNSAKKVTGIETIESQLSLFHSLPPELQELFLLSSLVDIEAIEKYMDTLLSAWKSGNMRRLEVILKRGLDEYPELQPFYDRVFYQRNKNMADAIEDYLASGKLYFVVVGAGHLVGSEGIIQILQNRGYFLRQY